MIVIKAWPWILGIILFYSCVNDQYIKNYSEQEIGRKKIIVEISVSHGDHLPDKSVMIRRFCIGSDLNKLEQNCELDPIILNYTITTKEPIRISIPAQQPIVAKILFQHVGHWESAKAAAYFTDQNKISSSTNCAMSGVSVEGFPKFLCNGFKNTNQIHKIQLKYLGKKDLEKPGSGGDVIDKIILGPMFIPAEVVYELAPP
ncbi:hypothetical protein [Leptospira dzoumogneensis]|uniref:Lipoprotein n=1 Tax=Leptospira dzoumogneensis TaxID=2484904 RepID=A0A4Z1AQ08_9LEPT|nr:hypothetical protein [Leptospira dzoumogneensis]TGN03024.1 hypothetical protein EHR06_03175 [Leptospira dzoumogneensis]